MLRSVDREDCAESGGDCFCCEARRRLWGGKPSLGLWYASYRADTEGGRSKTGEVLRVWSVSKPGRIMPASERVGLRWLVDMRGLAVITMVARVEGFGYLSSTGDLRT